MKYILIVVLSFLVLPLGADQLNQPLDGAKAEAVAYTGDCPTYYNEGTVAPTHQQVLNDPRWGRMVRRFGLPADIFTKCLRNEQGGLPVDASGQYVWGINNDVCHPWAYVSPEDSKFRQVRIYWLDSKRFLACGYGVVPPGVQPNVMIFQGKVDAPSTTTVIDNTRTIIQEQPAPLAPPSTVVEAPPAPPAQIIVIQAGDSPVPLIRPAAAHHPGGWVVGPTVGIGSVGYYWTPRCPSKPPEDPPCTGDPDPGENPVVPPDPG